MDETRKLREGDQPLPTDGRGPQCHDDAVGRLRRRFRGYVVDLVTIDLESRLQVGLQRYGKPLQPFNGRDFIRDQYEELLDALAYGAGCLYELNEKRYEQKRSSEEYEEMYHHYLNLQSYALYLRAEMRRRTDA